ncbi:MAG: dienelactone hydrolase family protein [Candidatus Odyssella sp.]|nr:dienelactone hydrolase family protein [Candidatus Odyssella sp.]
MERISDAKAEHVSLVPDAPLSRRGFVVTSIATGFAAAAGPVAAQSVIKTDTAGLEAKEIKIPTKDGNIPGYVAMPAQGSNFPVVMVVQEIFGVHEHIQDLCRRLAKSGYLAVAPELYARQGDPRKYTMQEIQKLISEIVAKVPDAQVMSDLDATMEWAGKNKGNADKVAITGFCWGGRIVWLYAAHSAKLKAGVAWYGRVVGQASPLTPKNPIDVVADIKAPVLGLYGGKDQGIPNDTVQMMESELKKAGKKAQIVMYPEAPHGFNADFRATYREADAKDGWKRMLDWFKANGVS